MVSPSNGNANAETSEPPAAHGQCRKAFWEGVAAPKRGFKFMWQHRKLWAYGILPTVVNVLLTLTIFAALLAVAAWFTVHIQPLFPDNWWGNLLKFGSIPILIVLAAGTAVISWFLLGGIICGHFYSRLAARVEILIGTHPETLMEVPFKYQIVDTTRDLLWLLLANGSCVLLNVIPVVGTIAAPVASLTLDSFIFGLDFLDHPMALRGMRRKEKRAFCWANRFHTVGLGAVVLVLTFIPIVGSVLLTSAVAGAVLLYHDLIGTERTENAAIAPSSTIVD